MLLISELSLQYSGEKQPLFSRFSLELKEGELAILKAPSGAGKTSLLNAISSVIPEHIKASVSGRISLKGVDLTRIALPNMLEHLAYQTASQHFFFPLLSHELAFPLENLGIVPDEILSRIELAARRFGIESRLLHDAGNFSVGEAKLVAWAICELIDAPLLLLDEPCKGMSEKNLALLWDWLVELKARGKIILIAEHGSFLDPLAEKLIRW